MILSFGWQMKTTIKQIRPNSIHASFEYICSECNNNHWIFLHEAMVKDYKIVCECGNIIIPDTIAKIDIIYQNSKSVTSKSAGLEKKSECCKILESYGYSATEVEKMYECVYAEIDIDNTGTKQIIEYILKNFGGQYV